MLHTAHNASQSGSCTSQYITKDTLLVSPFLWRLCLSSKLKSQNVYYQIISYTSNASSWEVLVKKPLEKMTEASLSG